MHHVVSKCFADGVGQCLACRPGRTDDVLDALSPWAPRHSIAAYDAVAASRTGLPWPDLTNYGGVTLLQTLRHAAGAARSEPALNLVLPVPGDVRA